MKTDDKKKGRTKMNYPKELTSTYDIQKKIGEGGGGEVYLAMHKRLQKYVVIKKIKSTVSIKDCRTEVDILKNLRHSYLPQVIDFIEIRSEDGRNIQGVYTVMDFIPGQSLQSMMDAGHRFTEKEVLKYAGQLCEALKYLHSQNPPIIHGDIKPDNIMITPEGNVCLIDFNISGMLEGQGIELLGLSYGYASPEQLQAGEEVKKQMEAERVRRAEEREVRQMQQQQRMQHQNENQETVLLNQEDNQATVLLKPLLQDDQTVLLTPDSDRTVLLSEVAAAKESVQQESVVSLQPVQTPFQPKISVTIDKRSDVFSVGATLYTLFTGKFYDYTAKKKLSLPEISDGFLIVLSKALEKKPDKRYTDAGAMLQALSNVHKKDKKYRRLLLKQEFTIILFIFLTAASAFLMMEGKYTMEREWDQRYEDLIAVLEEGVEEALTPEEFEQYYTEAIGMHKEDVAPYYAKAYYVFHSQGEEKAKRYMESVFDLPLEGSEDIFCNLYYLYAECMFRAEDYENAQWYYKKALSYKEDNPALYRDYAISLVYLNRVEEAKVLLEKAAGKGMNQTDIYMVQGEIYRISGNYEDALACFSNVVNESEEEYVIQRACIMGSKTYEAMGTTEALLYDVQWMSEGIKLLSAENRILIYERMVQDYIALGEATKDNRYYAEGIEVLKEIVSMGWDSYLTYSNIIVLYQRSGNMAEARVWADKMKKEYTEHYVTYIRLAFAELEVVNALAEDDRDYSDFVRYYEEAQKRYKQQSSGNVTNAELLLLENAYQQLIDGNWITE